MYPYFKLTFKSDKGDTNFKITDCYTDATDEDINNVMDSIVTINPFADDNIIAKDTAVLVTQEITEFIME